MRRKDTSGQLCLPLILRWRSQRVSKGVTTAEAIVTPSFTMQALHRSRQRKASLHTKIPPSSGMFRGHSRGGIFKQDKVPSVTGQFTSPGNAVRGRKTEVLQGFREKTKIADRYEKSVCYAPISHFFRLPSLKSLSVLDSLRCLFTAPIPNFKKFKKDEVIPYDEEQ